MVKEIHKDFIFIKAYIFIKDFHTDLILYIFYRQIYYCFLITFCFLITIKSTGMFHGFYSSLLFETLGMQECSGVGEGLP